MLVTVALAAAAACGGGSDAIGQPSPNVGFAVDKPVPAAIRNLPLTKPDGSTTTLAAFTGKPVLIADYLTLCTDICPMITANVVTAARAIRADGYAGKIALLELTVDPHRDTPARLSAYQRLYGGPIPGWTLLRASPADTAKFWRFFGVGYHRVKEGSPPDIDWLTHKPLTYDVAHTDAVLFLDARGHLRFVIDGSPDVQGRQPPKPLTRLLSSEGIRNLNHPQQGLSWTVGQVLDVFSWLTNHRLADPA